MSAPIVTEVVTRRSEPVPQWRPFPLEHLPEALRAFVTIAARAMGCDPSYIALPAMVSAAACIGNSRSLLVKRGWYEPAVCWGAIVGESGTLKTPAFRLIQKPLREIQKAHFADHGEKMQEYQQAKTQHEAELTQWKRKPDGDPPQAPVEPQAERILVSDTTVEGLAPILQANPRGVLLARDELAGWIGAFDRYAGGRGADAAHWLSMFGGETIFIDRKTGNPRIITVDRASVSVIGGIQPAILHRTLGVEHRASGLAARLLLAWPPRKSKRWTEADIPPEQEAVLAGIYGNLLSLCMLETAEGWEPALVRMNAEARQHWIGWYDRHADEHEELTGDLAAAWSKLEGYGARLALVIHLIRWAAGEVCDPDLIDRQSMVAGCALADWFGNEARRVYAALGETDEDREQRELIELIRQRGGELTARELQHRRRRYRRDAEEAEAVLQTLVDAGLGRWDHRQTGGRPQKVFVLVDGGSECYPESADNTGNGNESPPRDSTVGGSVTVTSVTTSSPDGSVTAPQHGDGRVRGRI
jgi:hypothetical protein